MHIMADDILTEAGPSRTVALRKRGGSGDGAAITGTVPNHPPSSTDTVHGHHIPKINGSESGFWGLTFGLAALVLVACLAAWYLLLRRRRTQQSLPPPNPFSCFGSRRRSAKDPTPSSTAQRKRGWIEGTSRAWDTLGDDEDGGGYGLGGLKSPGRQRAYGQGGLESPGLDVEGDRRERFGSFKPESTTYSGGSGALPTSNHPYGSGTRAPGDVQYATRAADSSLSFSSSPPRAPYRSLEPSASSSTIRLVSPQQQADENPFDDSASTFSTATREIDDDPRDERTIRPTHDRGDSRGSRFIEGE